MLKYNKYFFYLIISSSYSWAGNVDKFSNLMAENNLVEGVSINKNLTLPRQLIELIEKDYAKSKENNNKFKTENFQNKLKRNFLNIKMEFKKEDGALIKDDSVFKFPRGGGIIELSNFVLHRTSGSFRVIISVEVGSLEDNFEANRLRVFFLSQLKPGISSMKKNRTCDSILEITSFFKNIISKKGVLITSHTYLDLLVGHFYFIYSTPKSHEFYLGGLTFEDRRYSHSMCSSNTN